MDPRRGINERIEQLKKQIQLFCDAVSLYMRHDSAEEGVDQAWSVIFNDVICLAHQLLTNLAEDIRWSLLDSHQDVFKVLYGMLSENENCLAQHVSLKIDTITLHRLKQLLVTGQEGFQRLVSEGEDYNTELFEKEYQQYKRENIKRIEEIYQQDSNDYVFDFPDVNERKLNMVKERKQKLFSDFFGSFYHDHGRRIPVLTLYIIEQKEPDYKRIHAFFDKYLSWEYAEQQFENKDSKEYINLIFRENADVDKIMRKLLELVESKTIKSQRHWFIAYKVFETKKWLSKNNQTRFREQINTVFGSILKSTEADFKEIDNYFKKTDYAVWDADDPKAPTCCKEYIKIAQTLDAEFQEKFYAIEGLRIAPQKRTKFS